MLILILTHGMYVCTYRHKFRADPDFRYIWS